MRAVSDEQLIVVRPELTFINIPIHFDNLTEAAYETVAAVGESQLQKHNIAFEML